MPNPISKKRPGKTAAAISALVGILFAMPLIALASNHGDVLELPTIVIYLSDDHSQFDCELYGASDIATPNFRKLANRGMVFSHAFVASPSCAPSRAAMLTGLMPARNGAEANHTFPPPGTHYLIQDLQAAGYEVVALGKVGHGKHQKRFGFDHVAPAAGYQNLRRNVGKYLETRQTDQPLCLFVGISNPHVPWPVQSTFDPDQVQLPPVHLDTPSTRIHRAAYYQEIKEVDLLMGELRSRVNAKFGDNVLFIHTSDHGSQWPFGKWTLYDYGTRVPLLISWPGVIQPGSESNAMVSWTDLLPTVLDLVGGKTRHDIDGQSFASVLKGARSSHRQRIFTTHSGDGPMNIYPIRAVRSRQWKLIHNLHPEFAFTNHSDLHRKPQAGEYWTEWAELAKQDPAAKEILDRYYQRPEWEFYDVSQDKWEQDNRINDRSVADQVRTMKRELANWMEGQGDQETVFNTPRRLDDPKSWHPDFDNRKTPIDRRNENDQEEKSNSSTNATKQIAYRSANKARLAKEDWKPKPAPILTRWAKQVSPENVWSEYPRPQMVREQWTNLNGLWDYSIQPRSISAPPEKFQGKILVPFSIESPLSGVGKVVSQDETIWYRRTFRVDARAKQRTLLNFEAADWRTVAWVNGERVGVHEGGYAPFSFDVTEALKPGQQNELVVQVWDPQTKIFKSLGKQKGTSQNYQRCSGIWQTVWLEQVSQVSLETLKIRAEADGNLLIETKLRGSQDGAEIEFEVFDGGTSLARFKATEGQAKAKIENAKIWSPKSPSLYQLRVAVHQNGSVVDQVNSYFGCRTISTGWAPNGNQILLNGRPIFQIGPLDQNYWPGGGLTPPSDDAMKWECQYLKDIGCNMVRLHIKQNPRRWYMHCDRLGLLVWQDFISAQTMRENEQRRAIRPLESKTWMAEQTQLMDALASHPSVVMWIVFNESWGQHNSRSLADWARRRDNSRLASVASGWYDLPGVGQVRDVHDYTFHPSIPVLGSEIERVVVLGECGGFASAVPPHNWTGRRNQSGLPVNPLHGGFDPGIPRDKNIAHDIFRPTFSYGKPFEKQYERFVDDLRLLKAHGLTAAVYTQLTDMKREENGWLTFDREVSKIDRPRLARIHARLDQPIRPRRSLIRRMDHWEYALLPPKQPAGTKRQLQFSDEPDFADAKWQAGQAPFGNARAYQCRTTWNGKRRIVLRQIFELDSVPENASMQFYTYLKGTPRPDGSLQKQWQHARVYLNNIFVCDESTRLTDPEQRVAEVALHAEILKYLKSGPNKIEIEIIPGLDPQRGRIGKTADEVFFDFSFFEIIETESHE